MTIIYSSTLNSTNLIAIVLILVSTVTLRVVQSQQVNPITFPQDDGLSAYKPTTTGGTTVTTSASANVPGASSISNAAAATPGNSAAFVNNVLGTLPQASSGITNPTQIRPPGMPQQIPGMPNPLSLTGGMNLK